MADAEAELLAMAGESGVKHELWCTKKALTLTCGVPTIGRMNAAPASGL